MTITSKTNINKYYFYLRPFVVQSRTSRTHCTVSSSAKWRPERHCYNKCYTTYVMWSPYARYFMMTKSLNIHKFILLYILNKYSKPVWTQRHVSFETRITQANTFLNKANVGINRFTSIRFLQAFVILDFHISLLLDRLSKMRFFSQGEMKQTNETRAMVGSLVRGMLPSGWRRYAVARGCTVQQWIDDFARRVTQLATVSSTLADQGAKRLQVCTKCLRNITSSM